MDHRSHLPAPSASVSRIQLDRRADSHDVLSDHDLQLLALEGHSPRVSVSRSRTQDGLHVGSRLAVDSRERAAATASASALRDEFSDESIRLSAKKESSWFFKLMTKPGVWLQNITTQEPDDQQLEVAIEALKESLKLEPTGEPVPAPLS